MPIVKSLLTAIVRADAEALVMHVGERPYVVTTGGHLDLSTSQLSVEAMSGMLTQLLPPDAMTALSEFGAVEHYLQPPPNFRDQFDLVAARGGDDIWIEIRRKRGVFVTPPPVVVEATPPSFEPVAVEAPVPAYEPVAAEAPGLEVPEVRLAPEPQARYAEPERPAMAEEMATEPPPPAEFEPVPLVETATHAVESQVSKEEAEDETKHDTEPEVHAAAAAEAEVEAAAEGETEEEHVVSFEDGPAVVPAVEPCEEPQPEPIPTAAAEEPGATRETLAVEPPEVAERVDVAESVPAQPSAAAAEAAAPGEAAAPLPAAPEEAVAPTEPAAPALASVVPLTRTVRIEVPPRPTPPREGDIERLLGIAAARGASVLYLTSHSRPFLRVEGDIRPIEGEPTLTGADVEAAVLALMPEAAREAHGRGEAAEWISEVDGVGRVHCTTFRDYHGAGALFHLISARPTSAERLGLSREIQALAMESEGLVVVAAPRRSGKSTVVAALVDAINRQLGGYIVSLERQIRIVHENRLALVSQREVPSTAADVTMAHAALRENPDVLVFEDTSSPEMTQIALDAAASGLLVFVSVTAASTVSALTRLIDLFPPERRKTVEAMLAERLLGAVGQVLLHKTGGGRVAARELLLPTSAVASMIAEGQIAQLAVALDSGRKYGMVPLNDALLGFVRSGVVDPREACRKAYDRAAFLTLLKREGIDTSFLERLA